MTRWNIKLRQALYPPEFRIVPDDDDANLALAVSELAAMVESCLERMPAGAAPEEPGVPVSEPDAGPDKAFVIDLCNQVHRLSRAVKKAQEQGSSEAGRLQRHMDQLAEILKEHDIEWQDLSGQAYHPGRADFEALGQPQPTPGLTRETIVQCERPAITLAGILIQSAKGIVGQPPA